MFIWNSVFEICSKFTEEHPCYSVISIKLLWNLIEITLPHGCSPANLLHIFRTPFPENTFGELLLYLLGSWGFKLGETHYGNSSGNFHWTKETIRIKKVPETESQITESTEYCLIQTFMLFWHFQTICLYYYYIITSLFKALDILI